MSFAGNTRPSGRTEGARRRESDAIMCLPRCYDECRRMGRADSSHFPRRNMWSRHIHRIVRSGESVPNPDRFPGGISTPPEPRRIPPERGCNQLWVFENESPIDFSVLAASPRQGSSPVRPSLHVAESDIGNERESFQRQELRSSRNLLTPRGPVWFTPLPWRTGSRARRSLQERHRSSAGRAMLS